MGKVRKATSFWAASTSKEESSLPMLTAVTTKSGKGKKRKAEITSNMTKGEFAKHRALLTRYSTAFRTLKKSDDFKKASVEEQVRMRQESDRKIREKFNGPASMKGSYQANKIKRQNDNAKGVEQVPQFVATKNEFGRTLLPGSRPTNHQSNPSETDTSKLSAVNTSIPKTDSPKPTTPKPTIPKFTTVESSSTKIASSTVTRTRSGRIVKNKSITPSSTPKDMTTKITKSKAGTRSTKKKRKAKKPHNDTPLVLFPNLVM